jgi:hypothetical protein
VSAPPGIVRSTTIDTNGGDDRVVIDDYINATTINLGDDNDFSSARDQCELPRTASRSMAAPAKNPSTSGTGNNATTAVNGGTDNQIVIGRVGSSPTVVSAMPATIPFRCHRQPAISSVTTLHGDDPASLPAIH